MHQHSIFNQPNPNVIGGPRCGEFWPVPTKLDGQASAYVDLSDGGVCCLYLFDDEKQRWKYRISTSKEKLIEEFRRRKD